MVKRVFIYGQFLDQVQMAAPSFLISSLFGSPPGAIGTAISDPELAPQAIEILREPSVLELIGKIYVLTASRNYQPVTPLGVRTFDWYERYQRASVNKEKFYFKAKEGDLWQVPWMRQESDDSGSYVAVALKHD